MDEDALLAMGTVLAALGGLLERKGVCTAETLVAVAFMTQESGEQYKNRAAYIGQWAHMVRAATLGRAGASQH